MATVGPPVAIDLALSMGCVFVSVLIETALWGALCVQTIYYYLTFVNDSWILKVYIGFLWCIATVHDIVIIKGLWRQVITFFGDLEGGAGNELTYQCIFTAIAGFSVQIFFMIRIYQYSTIAPKSIFNNKAFQIVFPLLMAPLMVFQFVAYIIYPARLLMNPAEYVDPYIENLAIAINATVTTVDVCITLVTCVMLYMSQTGFKGTNRILRNMIFVSLNSGLWTSLFAILTLSFMLTRSDLVYAIFDLAIMGTYCNTILGNINSRAHVAGSGSDYTVSTFNVVPIEAARGMPDSFSTNHDKEKSERGDLSHSKANETV